MGKPRLGSKEIKKIINLRKTGHSVPEIACATGCGKATVFRYIQGVQPHGKYAIILREKQGGSKIRAARAWEEARIEARKMIGPFSERDLLCVLTGLYWGEGTKRELNLINSDPNMIKMFILGIKTLGVRESDIRISLRLFDGISSKKAIRFWKEQIGVKGVYGMNYVRKGAKEGRHPNGMCRVRVVRSARYFKLLMSLIQTVIESSSPRSSTDRTVAS